MKYEYVPFQLKAWIRDNHHALPKLPEEDMNKRYKGRLEKLKEQFTVQKHASNEQMLQWLEQLTPREKLLLPYLYEKNLDERLKEQLLLFMQKNIKKHRRIFRVLLDVFYKTCDFDAIWHLVRYSYVSHIDSIERRMEGNQSKRWREFLQSTDQVKHLAIEAYTGGDDFYSELETFYLSENMPLFKYVLLDVLEIADEEFFIKEQKLFRKYFEEGTNMEQQKMAHNLIKNCKLNRVKELGRDVIFEKLKTYTRKPMLWKFVGEEEKRRFSTWINRQTIRDFFGNANKNHERFIYWNKFIMNIENIVITDRDSTMIMYFKDVVIMEVLGTGAVYVYDVATFQKHFQSKIDSMLEEKEKNKNSWIKPREVRRTQLMDQALTVEGGWLIHNGGWQYKFDNWLRFRLGWEVNERVLSQKEAEGDEGDFNA